MEPILPVSSGRKKSLGIYISLKWPLTNEWCRSTKAQAPSFRRSGQLWGITCSPEFPCGIRQKPPCEGLCSTSHPYLSSSLLWPTSSILSWFRRKNFHYNHLDINPLLRSASEDNLKKISEISLSFFFHFLIILVWFWDQGYNVLTRMSW